MLHRVTLVASLLLCIIINSPNLASQEGGEENSLNPQTSESERSNERIQDSTLTSPTHYQAIGNAHFDRGEYGYAILAYERGLRLQPNNRALANNLKYVRGEAGIDRPVLKEFFLVRWWRSFGAWLGVATAKWIALLCWALAVAGAAVWYLRKDGMAETRRFALLPSSGFLLALAFVFYLLGNSRQAYLENDRDGVLVTDRTELRVAPGPDATLEETLSQGLKVRILDEFESYVKVSLENGRQGWVKREVIERI